MADEREMRSPEFRLTYNRLREPVTVTVLGHPIGRWIPIHSATDSRALDGIRPGEPASPEPVAARAMTQRERDAVLRKANKGGKE